MFHLKKKKENILMAFLYLTGDWEEDKTVTDSDKGKNAKLFKDI